MKSRAVRPSGLGRAAARALFLFGIVAGVLLWLAMWLAASGVARLFVLIYLLTAVRAPWWMFAIAGAGEAINFARSKQ